MPLASPTNPIFKSAFRSADDEFLNQGIRPVVFDILAPDHSTSVLPEGVRLVLHVNPSSMAFSYSKQIERMQTKGGFVEQHWGEAARSIAFEMATGGFKRLYSGLSNVTGGVHDVGGTRRETIAYDKYLDMLSLFHNNGAIYDVSGQIAFQGIIKVTFDGGIYLGWFQSFTVNESADKPYQFDLSAEFTVAKEILRVRSVQWHRPDQFSTAELRVGEGGITMQNQTVDGTNVGGAKVVVEEGTPIGGKFKVPNPDGGR